MSSNPVQRAGEVKHVLAYPVTFEGVEHSEITLRRLKGKDLRKIDGLENGTDKTFQMMGLLSGWPPEAFDEMDAADIDAVGSIVEGFIGKRRRR